MRNPYEIVSAKSDDDLLAMLARPSDWQPEVIDAARIELAKRGVEISSAVQLAKVEADKAELARLNRLTSEELHSMTTDQAAITSDDTKLNVAKVLESRNYKAINFWKPGDYIAFVIGVFVLGGFVVFPLIAGNWYGFEYTAAVPWSLVSSFVFVIAFNRDGSFSGLRAIVAVIYVVILAREFNAGGSWFLLGGFIGALIASICGYIGIGISRLLRKASA